MPTNEGVRLPWVPTRGCRPDAGVRRGRWRRRSGQRSPTFPSVLPHDEKSIGHTSTAPQQVENFNGPLSMPLAFLGESPKVINVSLSSSDFDSSLGTWSPRTCKPSLDHFPESRVRVVIRIDCCHCLSPPGKCTVLLALTNLYKSRSVESCRTGTRLGPSEALNRKSSNIALWLLRRGVLYDAEPR